MTVTHQLCPSSAQSCAVVTVDVGEEKWHTSPSCNVISCTAAVHYTAMFPHTPNIYTHTHQAHSVPWLFIHMQSYVKLWSLFLNCAVISALTFKWMRGVFSALGRVFFFPSSFFCAFFCCTTCEFVSFLTLLCVVREGRQELRKGKGSDCCGFPPPKHVFWVHEPILGLFFVYLVHFSVFCVFVCALWTHECDILPHQIDIWIQKLWIRTSFVCDVLCRKPGSEVKTSPTVSFQHWSKLVYQPWKLFKISWLRAGWIGFVAGFSF